MSAKKRRKAPRFFRTAASDQEKLNRAKAGRDAALKRMLDSAGWVDLYSRLVDKYETSLGLSRVELPETPERSDWLKHALDRPAGKG